MNRDTLRQLITWLTIVFTIVVNILANALPLNGQNTGEISDRFPIYFVPAGYVFSIWGLIYLGLIAYGIFQTLPAQKENPRLRAAFVPFVIANVANAAWIFLWHYNQFPATIVAMAVLLASLIVIYLRLRQQAPDSGAGERWMVRLPISLYLGWITVATIANASQVLFSSGWNGGILGPAVWTVIMLAVAVALAALMAFRNRDVAFLLVLVWAFIGIAVKDFADPSLLVTISAWVAAAAVGILAFLASARHLWQGR